MSGLYYLDASAWVKRYFAEAGSAWMHTLFAREESSLASTVLGYVEVAATLARRTKPAVPLLPLQHQLQTEWDDMLQFELTGSVYTQALQLAWAQKLRGADAVHLASARQLRDETERRSLHFVLVTSDAEIIRGAKSLGLSVTNPAELT